MSVSGELLDGIDGWMPTETLYQDMQHMIEQLFDKSLVVEVLEKTESVDAADAAVVEAVEADPDAGADADVAGAGSADEIPVDAA